MSLTEVAVAIAIAVGLVGILVPILPGTLLVLAAILVWAAEVGSPTAWGSPRWPGSCSRSARS